MNKTILNILIVGGIFFTSVSCNKFIETPMDNRVGIEELSDLEKSIILLEPGSDHHFTDLMTDDYTYKLAAGHTVRDAEERLRPIYNFAITKETMSRDVFLPGGMNPSSAFQRYYFRLNNANMLINRAERLLKIDMSALDIIRVNNVIAHAKTIRAYCHFMATNLFGKQYNESTSGTDLAVPYIGEYNPNAVVHRPRATVKYVYDKVEEDLLDALKLIDDKDGHYSSKFYFSKSSIHAFLNRFYLYKKNYSEAIKHADLVLADNNNLLNIRQIRTASANNYDLYSKTYFDPANTSYLFMGNNTYQLIAYFWHGLYIDPLVAAMRTNSEAIQTSPLVADLIPIKILYFYSSANRSFNLPLFTVDEVVYNKLESMILKDLAVSVETKTEMKRLVTNHFTAQVASANNTINSQIDNLATVEDGIALLLRIKRIRFHAEGIRWFDLKRHQMPILHDYMGTEFKIDGTNPDDYVIKLPLEEINFNEDID